MTSDLQADVPQGPRIFISYRRADCQPQANGLNYGLRHRLRGANVFMDLDSIPPGEDFEAHIRAEIEKSDLVLVLIGDNWLDPVDDSGRRRLDDPLDFVRLEIEAAIEHGVKIIPLLVEGAQAPRSKDLPESIRALARRQALELSEQRFSADMERLATYIENADLTRRPGAPAPKAALAAPTAGLTPAELAEAEASLPKRVTKRWLLDTVHTLRGRQVAALAAVLKTRRGWSDQEIADYVYLSVDHAETLVKALEAHGWPAEEIEAMVAILDPPGERPGPDTPIPARVTDAWLEGNVPWMDRARLDELVEVLRGRRWSEGWLIDYVYSLAAPSVRPPVRPLPGDPERSELVLPPRCTKAWLKAHVPDMDRHDVAALIVGLKARGWSDGWIEDFVWPYVRDDVRDGSG